MNSPARWPVILLGLAMLRSGPALAQTHGPSIVSKASAQESVPAGSFTRGPSVLYQFHGSPPIEVTGDFNGDGIPDLAVSDYINGSVWILLGDGTGQFAASPEGPFQIGAGSYIMAASDFNNDGKTDLAVVLVPASLKSVVLVLLSDGSGGFTISFTKNIQFLQPSAMVGTDLDGDGNPDLAIADLYNLTVLIGDGAGGFSTGTGGGAAAQLVSQPTEIAAGDFNGDGKIDLAISNRNTNNVTVLLGDGFGGFTPAAGSPIEGAELGPNALVVGDFQWRWESRYRRHGAG